MEQNAIKFLQLRIGIDYEERVSGPWGAAANEQTTPELKALIKDTRLGILEEKRGEKSRTNAV